jgi:NarL family two-component system response regulator LiaR
MIESIRVLIADDHAVVRTGLRALIGLQADMEVVGEAADGLEAVELARSLQPDVILLDLVMPRMGGQEAIVEIKQENPQARILVLTSFAEDEQVFPAIKAGALGYLLKDSSPRELLQAIRAVHRGESSLHPTVARMLVQEIRQPPALPPTEDPLTPREMETLRLVAQGLNNREIAERLVIGQGTVRNYVSNILSKLHLANRVQAALYAVREGIIGPDED